jgi:hypothetical protein
MPQANRYQARPCLHRRIDNRESNQDIISLLRNQRDSMKMRFLAGLISLLLSMSPVSLLHAGIVYDNGGPNQYSSNEMTSSIQVQSFMLTTARIITGVRFWAVDWDRVDNLGYVGQIMYFIYDDSAASPGTPGDILASGTFTGDPVDIKVVNMTSGHVDVDEYRFEFIIPDFYAEPNRIYHLGVHNGALSNIKYSSFAWETTASNGTPTGKSWNLYHLEWRENLRENAFQLFGIPVPKLADAISALQILSRMNDSTHVYEGIDVNDDQMIGMPEALFTLQKLAGVR